MYRGMFVVAESAVHLTCTPLHISGECTSQSAVASLSRRPSRAPLTEKQISRRNEFTMIETDLPPDDLTDAERNQLAQFRAACKDVKEAAAKLGMNKDTLLRLLAKETVRRGTIAQVRMLLEKM